MEKNGFRKKEYYPEIEVSSVKQNQQQQQQQLEHQQQQHQQEISVLEPQTLPLFLASSSPWSNAKAPDVSRGFMAREVKHCPCFGSGKREPRL